MNKWKKQEHVYERERSIKIRIKTHKHIREKKDGTEKDLKLHGL